MRRKLQSTFQASGIEEPALSNHTSCMAHVIQLASGAFMSSLDVKGCTKSWEAHVCHYQFGENEGKAIEKCQRLGKEGNARINTVSAMRPGLAKIIEKVHISTYCESPETDLQIAQNATWIDYADSWLSKWVLLRGCSIPIISTSFIELSTTAYLFSLSLLISSWNSASSPRLARASKSYRLQLPSPK